MNRTEWPTKGLEIAIEETGIDDSFPNGEQLPQGIEDITTDPESKKLIRRFAPDVRVRGLGLMLEVRRRIGGTWGGVLARALRKRDDNRICLQYVYVYTKQLGLVSPVLHGVLPFLLGLWSLFVLSLYSPQVEAFQILFQAQDYWTLFSLGDWWFPVAVTWFACIPIFVAGLIPHLDKKKKKRHPKVTTPFLILAPTMFYVVFSSLILIPMVDVPMVPWGLIIIGIIAIVGSGIFVVFRIKGTPGSHSMDYVPVFVWLRPSRRQHYRFECACWDYHHYRVDSFCVKRKRRFRRFRPDHLRDNERMRLYIDNPWHSMTRGIQKSDYFNRIVLFIFFMLASLAIWLLMIELYLTVWFVIVLFFLIATGVFVLRYPFCLGWPAERLTGDDAHLDEDKLRVLWNLKSEEAQFKIRKKLQNPFSVCSNGSVEMMTFNDDEIDEGWSWKTVLVLLILLLGNIAMFWFFVLRVL